MTDTNPRLYIYELVQDDSTGWAETIRVKDRGGNLIEDVPLHSASSHTVSVYRELDAAVDMAEEHLSNLRFRRSQALYHIVQSAWAQRGGGQ